ncbi:MAG TPA: YmdB family metallophosphoesterase [Candidatus Enterenecus merdae]|nr:YmdB family metallophosphoesterase [Candidatus Enterenecus merdae]
MILRVLAVGDVVGESGLDFLCRHLPALRKLHGVHFTVVNGENAASNGLLPDQVHAILNAGADVITLGNHTWDKRQIVPLLDECPCLLRPANYTARAPGRGWGIFNGPQGLRLRVVNLIGRWGMDSNFDNPFSTMDAILAQGEAELTLADFHGEATSEKGAMAWHLDGRAQALWGTHTHVPTADCQVLPQGLGFVTDLGMTGPAQSVIGIRPEQAVNRFLGGLPQRFQPASGPCRMDAVLFEVDTAQRRCVGVRRVDIC